MFNDYTAAAAAYKKVVELDRTNKYQLAMFWLAEMLRSACVCNTDESLKYLKRFKNRYHLKDYYSQKAQQEIESCLWVLDHKKQSDSVNIEHLGKEVNTTSSEFNAIPVYPDRIQFSSLRSIGGSKNDSKYLVRIYNQPPNPQKIYMPNGSDSLLNIGNGAYTPDTKTFYFTQCEPKNKVANRCDIYESRYENYRWSEAKKLEINDGEATNTQPAFGYDNKGQAVLFFASDRSGGQGGLDIWICRINKDGTYSPPVNAGSVINTPGNEVTPFYDVNSRQLYFSSDWHYGFGGYDIFKTRGEYKQWEVPVNMMQPVNTAQNDLYYAATPDDSRVYLTSNRKGSYFIEAATCCNDIYAYNTGKTVQHKQDTAAVAISGNVPPADSIVTGNITGKQITTATDNNQLHADNGSDSTIVTAANTGQPPHRFIDTQIKRMKQQLPVELYFHNDEPDCCNTRDTTLLDYKQTYEAYSALESEYKKEFSKGLQGAQKDTAVAAINNLFTAKVDRGFYDLVAFTAQLYDVVKAGNKIEITIKGYCSPLHQNDYNMKLGYRRVASLRNYFYHYRDGILMPYISSGMLVFKSESFGKETAPKTVSDNLHDTRNSVYNPAAAIERRVEIVSVELK